MGLAGLEYNITHKHQALFCPGYYQLPHKSHKYRDWKRWGHGKVDLDIAITQSCDVYFYDFSRALGIDKISDLPDDYHIGDHLENDVHFEAKKILIALDEFDYYRGKTKKYIVDSLINFNNPK